MRKLIPTSFISIFFFTIITGIALAQTPGAIEAPIKKDIPIPEVPPQTDTKMIGGYGGGGYPAPYMQQGMYQLAIFDKKGNAQVATKILFDTEDKEVLKEFSFFIPGKNIALSQVIHEKTIYKETCDGYPAKPLPAMERSISSMRPIPDNCYETYVPVYTTYKPNIQEKPDGIQVSLSVKPDIEGKGQESLLFSYRSSSLTKKVLGSFSYDIETPRVPLTLSTVQVGIVTKEGLTLRGAPPMYGPGYIPSLRALEKNRTLTEEENQELNQASNDLMYNGTVRKSDSDFAPNTSFEVDGAYGPNVVTLYAKEILLGIIIVVAIIAAIIFTLKKFHGGHSTSKLIIITIVVSMFSSTIVTLALAFLFVYGRMRGFIPY